MRAFDPAGIVPTNDLLKALRGFTGDRKIGFRYELLDKSNVKKDDIDFVVSGSIDYNSLGDIKRTAKFTIRDIGTINYLSDRLKPYAYIEVPQAPVLTPTVAYSFEGAANNSPSLRVQAGKLTRRNMIGDPDMKSASRYARAGCTGEIVGGKLRLTPGGTATAYTYPTVDNATTNGGGRFALDVGERYIHRVDVSNPTTSPIYVRAGTAYYLSTGGQSGQATDLLPVYLLAPGETKKLEVSGYNDGTNGTTGILPLVYIYATAGGGVATPDMVVDVSRWSLEKGPSAPAAGQSNFFSGNSVPHSDEYEIVVPPSRRVEWSLGVFLLATPGRTLVSGSHTMRDVEAYDQLLVLRDSKVVDRFTHPVGTRYTDTIRSIVTTNALTANITPSATVAQTAMEWEPGTSYLAILNDLLGAINYEGAFFDEDGVLVARPYLLPTQRPSGYTYATDSTSVIEGDIVQTIDLFDVPNRWALTKSEADAPPISSTYTNSAANSPTSTVNRGRVIVDFRTDDQAADQLALDARVARIAFEASQVYETIEFDTAIMPIHQHADVVDVVVPLLGVGYRFTEQSWTLPLKEGGTMSHKLRRMVTV